MKPVDYMHDCNEHRRNGGQISYPTLDTKMQPRRQNLHLHRRLIIVLYIQKAANDVGGSCSVSSCLIF